MDLQAVVWLIVAALSGGLLGIVYFGGLWLTIRRIQRSSRPGLLLLASFAVRLGVVMAGFFLVSGGEFGRLAACLAAFLITRWLFIKRIHPDPKMRSDFAGQAD